MKTRMFSPCYLVDDVAAAGRFYREHFGFAEKLANEFIVKLGHEDQGWELCFLQRGTEMFAGAPATTGVILAFETDDAAAEEARLRAAGVPIVAPLQDEEWGERLFQVEDPNGIRVQLVEWIA